MVFFFRIYKTAISYLRCSLKETVSEGVHRGLDFIVRQHLRTWTGLSINCTKTYFYASTDCGGLGVMNLFDEYNVQSMTAFHNLLNSKDDDFKRLARKELCSTTGTLTLSDALTKICEEKSVKQRVGGTIYQKRSNI